MNLDEDVEGGEITGPRLNGKASVVEVGLETIAGQTSPPESGIGGHNFNRRNMDSGRVDVL